MFKSKEVEVERIIGEIGQEEIFGQEEVAEQEKELLKRGSGKEKEEYVESKEKALFFLVI